MTFASDPDPIFAKPETMVRVPVGLASPLWGLFAGAAMSGAAWWWMTRWTQRENLEAVFGAAAARLESGAATLDAVTAEVVAEAEPVAEAAAEAVEAVQAPAQTVLEAANETAIAAEAVVEPPVLDAPVGGEAAPIAPAVAAEADGVIEPTATPKVRARKAETKGE